MVVNGPTVKIYHKHDLKIYQGDKMPVMVNELKRRYF